MTRSHEKAQHFRGFMTIAVDEVFDKITGRGSVLISIARVCGRSGSKFHSKAESGTEGTMIPLLPINLKIVSTTSGKNQFGAH